MINAVKNSVAEYVSTQIRKEEKKKTNQFLFWLIWLVYELTKETRSTFVHILLHFHCNKKLVIADTAKLIKRDRNTTFHVQLFTRIFL